LGVVRLSKKRSLESGGKKRDALSLSGQRERTGEGKGLT